jgi:hypothetical protein
MLDTTRAVVRKSLLAMLGAITLADDELEQLLDRLAARGEQVARDRFSHIEALRNRLTGSEGAAREGLREGALLRQTLQEEIERQGRLLAAALDLPTRDSINLLREQIEQISTMLNQIVAQHTPVTTPTDNGQAPAPAPATPVPQQAVETPAPAAVQPEAVETPAPAAVQPEAVETPAPAAVQPEAVETPAPAAVQPEAVETPAPAAVQPEAVETPAPAAVQPEAVETPAPAAVQPEAVETPAPAAVPQPELGEPSAPAAATQPELGEPSAPAAVQPEAVETPAPAAVTQPEVSEPSASTMTAPVAGYDALNAKQAAAIVAELEEADLLALYQYEQAHRNRITVLRAIEAALARHRGES